MWIADPLLWVLFAVTVIATSAITMIMTQGEETMSGSYPWLIHPHGRGRGGSRVHIVKSPEEVPDGRIKDVTMFCRPDAYSGALVDMPISAFQRLLDGGPNKHYYGWRLCPECKKQYLQTTKEEDNETAQDAREPDKAPDN